jgi:hypothetical protein
MTIEEQKNCSVEDYCKYNNFTPLQTAILTKCLNNIHDPDLPALFVELLELPNVNYDVPVEDQVPSYYEECKVMPIHFINGHKLNFNLGNIVKYFRKKGNSQANYKKIYFYYVYEKYGTYENLEKGL